MDFKLNQKGFGIFGYLVLPLVIVVIIFIALILITNHKAKSTAIKHTSNSSTSSALASNNLFKVLSPASVPPKVAECSENVTYASNGQPSPIQCDNGYLNVIAWNSLATIEPSVMTLGYNANVSQVQSAICADANAANADSSATTSNAIEATVYQISSLYYGWHFTTDPSLVLRNGIC